MKRIIICIALGIGLTIACKKDNESAAPQQNQGNNLPALELPCNLQGSDALVHADSTLILRNRNNDGADYIIECRAKVRGDLIIEPGVTIAFSDNGAMDVTGSIQALGTIDSNIVFTGIDKVPGAWGFVGLSSKDVKNQLEYCVFEYAGGWQTSSNGDKGNLVLFSSSGIKIDNCIFRHSAEYGVRIPSSGAEIRSFENNTLTQNKFPISLPSNKVRDLGSGSFSGNTNDFIYVGTGGTLTPSTINSQEQHFWRNFDSPYRMTKNLRVTSGTLEIEPGATLLFENGLSLDVGESDNATLIAKGTATDTITFSGIVEAPGAWGGIFFDFTQSPLNELDYCKIEYAGANGFDGAIYTWARSRAKVTNTAFKDISTCAIYFAPFSDNDNFTESNNEQINVAGGYICSD